MDLRTLPLQIYQISVLWSRQRQIEAEAVTESEVVTESEAESKAESDAVVKETL